MGFLDVAVRNARLTILALLFFLVAGAMSYISIPKEAEPDVQIPVVYVSVTLQGVSPEDAERLLVRPLETRIKNIKGLERIRFWMTFSDNYINHLRVLETHGLVELVEERVRGSKAERVLRATASSFATARAFTA